MFKDLSILKNKFASFKNDFNIVIVIFRSFDPAIIKKYIYLMKNLVIMNFFTMSCINSIMISLSKAHGEKYPNDCQSLQTYPPTFKHYTTTTQVDSMRL